MEFNPDSIRYWGTDIFFPTVNPEMKSVATEICNKLRQHNHETYLVGGCVRDSLLGRPVKDYDIATDAMPEEITNLFPRTIPVGVNFGVIFVLQKGMQFEVATFRSDGEYSDGRRPDSVKFSGAREDVMRRDFTINGLFMDSVTGEITDYTGGCNDIRNRIIRTIGKPADRFNEDKLRLLRAVRFAAQLNFTIESETFSAIKKLAPEIRQVSMERTGEELRKLLNSPNNVYGLELLSESGLLQQIIPEIEALKGVPQPPEYHPEGDVWTHTMLALKKADHASFLLILALLLHDTGKPSTMTETDRIRFNGHDKAGKKITSEICRRLRYPAKFCEAAAKLVSSHMKFHDVKHMKYSTLHRFLTQPFIEELLELNRIDCLASHKNLDSYYYCLRHIQEMESVGKNEIPALINGEHLKQWGYKPSPDFKSMLHFIRDEQLENRCNTVEQAREMMFDKYPRVNSAKLNKSDPPKS